MGFFDGAFGSIAGGLIGGISSLVSSSSAAKDAEKQRKWQEQMTERQNAFNAEQAELNRQFNSNEAAIARGWSSIGSQLARADAAGVNPYSLVSTGNYGSATSTPATGTPASAAGVPSPAGPLTYAAETQRYNGIAQLLSSVTQGVSALANAKKTGVDTRLLEDTYNDLVKKAREEATQVELNNSYQRFLNTIKSRTLKQEIEKIFKENRLLDAQYNVTDKSIAVMDAQISELLTRADVNAEQKRQIKRFVDEWMDRLYAAQENKDKASAADSYSHVQVNETQSELNKANKSFQELQTDIRKATSDVEKQAAYKRYIEQLNREGVITRTIQTQMEILLKDKNYYELDKFLGHLSSFVPKI